MRTYETKNYLVVVGERENETVYKVLNKDTKVVEYTDEILPRTLDAMMNLQDGLGLEQSRLDGEPAPKPEYHPDGGKAGNDGHGLH